MTRTRLLFPGLIAGTVIAVIAAVAFVALQGSTDPETDLRRARAWMADATFTARQPACSACRDQTMLIEFAPPDRIMIRNLDRYEAANFYLYSDGNGYASSEGKRWTEGFDIQILLLLLSDPRVLLDTIESPSFERTEEVSGSEARLFSGELDDNEFLQLLPPEFRDASEGGIRDFLASIDIQLWLAADDQRVLKLAVTPDLSQRPPRPGDTLPPPGRRDPSPEAFQRIIEYTDVTIPASVESRPYEEEDLLREPTEENAGRIALAVEEYFRRNGAYPSAANETTLAGLITESWPENAFRNRPIRDSEDAGDYGYGVSSDGAEYEFRIRGWDGDYLFFDSTRLDVPFQPRGRPPGP